MTMKGRIGWERLTDPLLRGWLDAHLLGGELLFVLARLLVLHEGEGEDLADAVVVGEEHDQAVDTHAPATGGR